jgi:Ni,Fe-hydrogenase I large subunit
MSDILLALLIIGLHAYWIYKLSTYDWTQFEEDSKNDDFLKPYDKY